MKHLKGGHQLMWCTLQTNMHQEMQGCGWKLPCLWKPVHLTEPCIHLGLLKRKPNLDLPLFSLFTPPPLPTKIIHDLILKSLKNIPNLILIKPTQSMSTIQLLYNFKTTSSLKYYYPLKISSLKKCYMGRDF